MHIKRFNNEGFTLLEIMIAVAILAISLLVILDFHSGAMISSRRGEDITTASMLAREKINEVQIKLEQDMAKGEVMPDDKQLEGIFEEPYERFKWRANIKKVELPVPQVKSEQKEGVAGMDLMIKIFQTVAERIGESAREVKLTVSWVELGEEQSVSVSTHIVKL